MTVINSLNSTQNYRQKANIQFGKRITKAELDDLEKLAVKVDEFFSKAVKTKKSNGVTLTYHEPYKATTTINGETVNLTNPDGLYNSFRLNFENKKGQTKETFNFHKKGDDYSETIKYSNAKKPGWTFNLFELNNGHELGQKAKTAINKIINAFEKQ